LGLLLRRVGGAGSTRFTSESRRVAEAAQGLAAKRLLNLNDLSAREDLLPALGTIADAHARTEAARQSTTLQAAWRCRRTGANPRLLTSDQFRQLKPLFVVRRRSALRAPSTGGRSRSSSAFLLVHVWWSVRGFGGDQWLLPATMLLAGAGLILMIALRDPVRDTLLFVDLRRAWRAECLFWRGQRAQL